MQRARRFVQSTYPRAHERCISRVHVKVGGIASSFLPPCFICFPAAIARTVESQCIHGHIKLENMVLRASRLWSARGESSHPIYARFALIKSQSFYKYLMTATLHRYSLSRRITLSPSNCLCKFDVYFLILSFFIFYFYLLHRPEVIFPFYRQCTRYFIIIRFIDTMILENCLCSI